MNIFGKGWTLNYKDKWFGKELLYIFLMDIETHVLLF